MKGNKPLYLSVIGRPHKGGNGIGHYTPRNTKEWGQLIAAKWKAKYGEDVATRGPVKVTATFFFMENTHADVDHLLGVVFNALNGLAWEDDSLIHEIAAKVALEEDKIGLRLRVTAL